MAYPMPSWLPGAPDSANQFLGGARLASQIQQEQQRLAQEANLSQLRLSLEAQEHERSSQLRQQELAQQQAYNTAQIQARQQELKQTQDLNNIKIQEAARLYQAQNQFRDWVSAHPQDDPTSAYFRMFAGTGAGDSGFGQMASTMWRQKMAMQPPKIVTEIDPVTGKEVSAWSTYNPWTGTQSLHPITQGRGAGASDAVLVRKKITALERRVGELHKQYDALDPLFADKTEKDFTGASLARFKAYEAAQNEIDRLQEAIDNAYDSGEMPTVEPRGRRRTGDSGVKVISIEPVAGAAAPPAAPGAAFQVEPPAAAAAPPRKPDYSQLGFGGQIALNPPRAAAPPPAAVAAGTSGPGAPFLKSNIPSGLGPQATLPATHATKRLYPEGAYKDKVHNDLVRTLSELSPEDLVMAVKRLGVTDASYYDGRFYVPGDSFDREDMIDFIADMALKQNLSPLEY